MTNWKLALTGTLMSLMMAATPAVSQELVKVGTFVPEKSVGVSRVIKPWMEAVSADVGGDVKLQGFWGPCAYHILYSVEPSGVSGPVRARVFVGFISTTPLNQNLFR